MNPWLKDALNFAAWCASLFVILAIYLHATSAVDIDISYDGDVTVESQGLELTDTLTINGELISGTRQWEDEFAWYNETWLNGEFYRRDVLYKNGTLGYTTLAN